MGIPLPKGVGASGLPGAGDQANGVVSGSFTGVGPGQPFVFLGPFNLSIYAAANAALTTTNGSANASVASGTGIAAGQAVNSVNVPKGTTWATFAGTSGTLALPKITLPGLLSTAAAQISGLSSTANLVGAAVSGPGIPAGTTVAAVITPAVPSNGIVPDQLGTVEISAVPTIATVNGIATPLTFALTTSAITTGVDANASFTGATLAYVGSVQLERSFDGGASWICAGLGPTGSQAVFATGTPVSLSLSEPERGVAYRLNCTAYTSGTILYRLSQTGAGATSLSGDALI